MRIANLINMLPTNEFCPFVLSAKAERKKSKKREYFLSKSVSVSSNYKVIKIFFA